MEVLLLWFVLAIVVGIIAGSRGRDGFGWFVLAVIISPLIAGILVLALPNPEIARREAEERCNSRKCPFCAELVKKEAVICKHCGNKLPPVPSAPPRVGRQRPAMATVLVLAVIAAAVLLVLERQQERLPATPPSISAPPAPRAKQETTVQPKRGVPSSSGALRTESNDPNEANRRLIAANEPDRRNFFLALLARQREQCSEVTRAFYQGSSRPSWNAIWNIECRGGPSYAVEVLSDGTTRILTCGELQAVGGRECFQNF
jgi:hypothetical protein